MDEDNLYKTKKSTQESDSTPESLTNVIPMPPKLLVELNPSVLEGYTLDNRFLIIRDLSVNDDADKGGIGLVYLAEDLKLLGKKVVIKILQETSSKNEDLARKFMHEKEALIRLDHHPNVVRILDSGTLSDGNPYMVMEYIHGYSLRRVLTENKQLPFDFCAHVIESISNALYAAHSKKILHRDIKPENIMLTPQEESFDHVRLIDFGIARVTNSQLAPATQIERGIGTVLYIPPEQLMGQLDQSPAADIYSFAIVTYEMLTGKLPFAPHTTVEMFWLQEQGVKDGLREIRPEIPEATERLILQALAFDPKNRPQNIRIFGRTLADSLRHIGDTQPSYKYDDQPADINLMTNDVPSVGETEDYPLNQSIVTEVIESRKTPVVPQTIPQLIATQSAENVKGRKPSRSLVRYGLSSLILLTVVSLAGFGWWINFGNSAGDIPVNANTAISSNTEKPPDLPLRQISDHLNVQKMRSGKPFEEPFRATGREIFENGYKFKMIINASEDGYLYLFNEGKNKDGKTAYYILYPTSKEKNSEQIKAESEVETGYQIFGGGKGTEIIWLIWTKQENAVLQTVKNSALDGIAGELQEENATNDFSAFLQQYDDRQIEPSKDSASQTTIISSGSEIIVHRLTLEHK